MSQNNNNLDNKKVTAIFHLPHKDSITLEGWSVLQIFFEMQLRFPENLKYNFVQFSGDSQEERFANTKKFYNIIKRYRG